MTEKDIESQILNWLNYQPGVFAFKVNTVGIWDPTKKVFRRNMNPHVHRGCADIIGVKDSRMFAIEVKTPSTLKRKQNEHDMSQTAFLERIKRAKGQAIKVCSIEQVIEFLRTF